MTASSPDINCTLHLMSQQELDYLSSRSLLTGTEDDLCVDVNKTGDTIIFACERVLDLLPKPCHTTLLEVLRNVYSFLGVVSLLCLLLTVYVYIKIKETERMQGKIILANVVATFFVNLFFLVVYNAKDVGRVFCLLLGYFGYLSNLAMFSWMSVMCFNLARTFFKLSLSQGSQKKKFIFYSSFATGLPLVLTITAGLLQVSLALL